MQKIILISLLSLSISINIYAQVKYSDSTLIEWNVSNKIKWGNFQVKADTTFSFTAESTNFFKCSFYLKTDSVFCRIQTFFNPEKSWRKSTYLDNSYDLNHEQLHFDITEIFARKIRQQIIMNNLNEEIIQKIFNASAKACNDFQDLYDKETNHSINKINQDYWTKKIVALLLSLDQYKEQSIYIQNPFCKICWK